VAFALLVGCSGAATDALGEGSPPEGGGTVAEEGADASFVDAPATDDAAATDATLESGPPPAPDAPSGDGDSAEDAPASDAPADGSSEANDASDASDASNAFDAPASDAILDVAADTTGCTLPAPTFRPDGGPVAIGSAVVLSDAAGASVLIFYTLDGTLPTRNSLVYAGPIQINSDTTIHAMAVSPDCADSPIVSAS
jgi:hypothetical protein